MMELTSKIYIAGHRGLVGSALHRQLQRQGYRNIVTRSHAELDLERQADAEAFFSEVRPDHVFLAAARVGGIWANATYPADFIYQNLILQTNVIHAAWRSGVNRLLFLGSSCIYPRECPQPMEEGHLLTGPLEPTNQPYAVAKIAGIVQCEAYNRQHGTRFLAVMPTNLYGPGDNFDLETSHVLPALIRKFHLGKLAAQGDREAVARDEVRFGPIPDDLRASLNAIAKSNGHEPLLPTAYSLLPAAAVVLWGTGSPRRELLHVDDLANACLFLMNLDDETFDRLCLRSSPGYQPSAEGTEPCRLSPVSCSSEPSATSHEPSAQRFPPSALRPAPCAGLPLINIGSGRDQTIAELASIVGRVVGYEGEIEWDTTKPDGTPRKCLNISQIKALGWSPRIDLEAGISSTYEWYRSQIRG